jgi:16S rRNA (guanine527-N7)-methyltransferase
VPDATAPVPELLPGLAIGEATMAALRAYAAALAHWTPAINLVAPATLPQLWPRHILDSAQLYPLAPASARRWADLGSGGGLPGLVIAILARDTPLRVTLVESDRRKAAFLRRQIADLQLAAEVRTARAEALEPLGADVVSARALAPLDRLLPLVDRHLAPGGVALLPKGRGWATEQAQVPARLFHVEQLPSATDPEARILRLRRRLPRA